MTDSRASQPTPIEQNTPSGHLTLESDANGGMGGAGDALISEILVEEVSIDGMCGVY
jgi:mycofactocin precursor